MSFKNFKWKRILLIAIGVVVVFIAVVIIFISPITKYVIEKYDEKFLGRQIKMSWAYVNPFTGYVHLHNLQVFEANSDTVFFSAQGLSVNFALTKVLSKTYEIKSLTLTKPWIRIVQNHKDFNLNDLITRFSPKDTTTPKSKSAPVHFNILDIALKNGEFHYEERSIGVNYYIKEVNIESPGMRWDVDSILVKFALKSGPETGDVKGELNLDLDSMEYRVKAKVNKYDLKFIEQYLRDFSNFGTFTANLDADVQASGNLGSKMALTAKGIVAVNDFHFGKIPGEDYVSFDKFVVNMIEVDPRNFKYNFDSIMLAHPFFKYERYDYLDNVQRMFGKGGVQAKAAYNDDSKFNLVIEIAKFVKDLAKNLVQSYYKAGKVAVYNGDVRFNDFSLREKFSVAANPLYVLADSIDRNHKRITVGLKTGLKPYGNLGVTLSFNPNDYGYFDIDYHLQKVAVSEFNPYVVTYTSFPLDRGTLEFNGNLNVQASMINCYNHLLIIDPRVGKRVNKKDTKWIPVPLIMSLARDRGDVIDYETPITGNLKDPKFHFWNVILHVLENIVIKPPSTPYIAHVKKTERTIERFLAVKWEIHERHLRPLQEKFLQKMADFLQKTPDASVSVNPLEYTEKEKEQILFFEAKKKYRLLTEGPKNIALEEDSMELEKMSIKDSAFVRYLDKLVKDTLMFTIQEKCNYFVGNKIVNTRFNQLLKARENTFLSYFEKTNVASQVKINSSEAGVPFNGFSYYKINYKGEFPDKLMKAYSDMIELNEEKPRSEYEKERKKNDGLLIEEKERDKKKK